MENRCPLVAHSPASQSKARRQLRIGGEFLEGNIVDPCLDPHRFWYLWAPSTIFGSMNALFDKHESDVDANYRIDAVGEIFRFVSGEPWKMGFQ